MGMGTDLDNLIFLGVDGVLNSNEWYGYLFKNKLPTTNNNMLLQQDSLLQLSRLQQSVYPYPKIIITSVWRFDEQSMKNIRNQFKNYGLEVYDITCRPQKYSTCRGHEIQKYLTERSRIYQGHYVIIDSDNDMVFNTFLKRLVRTNPEKGFTKEDCDKAISIFKLNIKNY